MKSQKGITLVSLVVYIIGMVTIVGVMAVITTNFYKNVNDVDTNINPLSQYTKFNSYFSNEINQYNIAVLECKQENGQNYIVFDNGVQYTFVEKNKGIYQNKIKICQDVTECTFSTGIQNGKDIVTVNMKIGNKTYNNTYTLKR